MKKVYQNILKMANTKMLLATVVLYLAYFFSFMSPSSDVSTKNGEYKMLDLMQFFTPDTFYATLNNYTQIGVNYYLSNIKYDFIYPLIYGFLFLLIMVMIYNKIGVKEKIAPWLALPFLAVITDFAENSSFIYLLNLWPIRADAMVYVALFFNTVKWFSVYISLAVVLVGLFKLTAKKNT